MRPNVLKGALLGAALLGVSVQAATIETLSSLSQPLSALPQVRSADGTFYGADFGTFNGGLSHGAILKLSQNGSLTSLYVFQAATPDEANPTVLIAGADGNFYGATAPRAVGDLNGMIFKLTPTGTFTPIYHFQDGKGTHATTLVQGADGNFYGTAAGDSSGGFFNHPASMHNPGIFFRLTPAGVFTVLYAFTGGADGSLPNALVQGKDGNFYGSTFCGPESPANLFNGNGTIFKITAGGVLTTLYSFTGTSDGANPGNVIEGADGNLYGIADAGTTRTVFKFTKAGQRSTVYNLQTTNGTVSAGLLASTDGNVYGTTKDGGIPKAGNIFRIDPAGQVTTWAFDGAGTGGQPSRPFEGAEHSLYGATALGGGSNDGTVYRLNMAPPRDLLNISTRLQVLTGDKVLIGGFIITGTDPKKVIVRGIGPSLSGVGVTLQDPVLELHQGNSTIATNDDWKEHQAEVEATMIAPTNDLESAIVATLTPGPYTAVLSGKNNGSGVGVVEVYDLDQAANSKLANISTRGFVDVGSNVMIGGLIVSGGAGGGNARVIVRALGPSLDALGVPGALPDPNLELHDASGATIASNDNWKMRPDGSSQQGEIEATAVMPGNDLESALVQTLPPGSYTVIVRGTGNTTGVAVVEAYTLE
ncbi:MAG TPA: choice-of-anchor tandem repeat GloVer-containing protein [Chthoniobacterales bacterium]|nr:choice-of-anchor tandem repeat GloVer-containing protein [Chthoniobacterales bacterium]